jgi:hypothetical protein
MIREMLKRVFFLILYISIFYPQEGGSFPIDSKGVEYVRSLAVGVLGDLVVHEDIAYISGIEMVSIMDVKDKERPYRLSFIDTPSVCYGLFYYKGYLYIACWDKGLCIVDVSDPRNPVIVTQFDTQGLAHDVEVVENGGKVYAYVVDGKFRVVDVTDPTSPKEIASIKGGFGIHIEAPYAYVTRWMGALMIIDISVPENPKVVGESATGLFYNYRVFVSEGYAYCVGPTWRSGFSIIDVRDKKNPRCISKPWIGSAYNVFAEGDYAYIVTQKGLYIFDVSDPENATKVYHYRQIWQGNFGVYVKEDYCYMATEDHLKIFNVAPLKKDSLKDPILVSSGSGFPYNLCRVTDLFVWDGHCYLANGRTGFAKVNVSDPYFPKVVGGVGTAYLDFAVNCYAFEGQVYWIFKGDWFAISRLDQVFAIPGAKLMGIYVIREGEKLYAYIACWGKALWIVDVTDPKPREGKQYVTDHTSSCKVVGSILLPGHARRVIVLGEYAYVASLEAGVCIVSVKDPSNPTLISQFDTGGVVRDVEVVEKGGQVFAYVADGYFGLRILDVTNPYLPKEIGYFDTEGEAYTLKVKWPLVYIADGEYGLKVVDVSLPEKPKKLGFFDTPGEAYGVDVVDDFIYVADNGTGLWILKYKTSISGCIRDDRGRPIDGVELLLSVVGDKGTQRKVKTGKDGGYILEDLSPVQSYFIKPEKQGYTFLPQTLEYSHLTESVSSQDFVGVSLFEERVRIMGGKNGWIMPDKGEVATIWLYPPTSGKVTLKIYTLRGVLVWEKKLWVDGGIEKKVVWECMNNSFKKVASGIYILYVKGAGIKKKCKLAIIR